MADDDDKELDGRGPFDDAGLTLLPLVLLLADDEPNKIIESDKDDGNNSDE